MDDGAYHLERFVEAQEGVYEQACAELRGGRKTGHWIWFIFPQMAGMGRSDMSRFYAIGSLEEAAAYLAHPVLGPRLREICGIVNALEGRMVEEIFGYPDDMKLRSSMTLFAHAATLSAHAAAGNEVFAAILRKYFDGKRDEQTLELLRAK